MTARLLIRERVVYVDGTFVEMVVWQLPEPVPPALHRFKYRLVYIADGGRLLGYDNERGKGDHRHVGDREEPVPFRSIDALIAQFMSEVESLRGERT
jgi:hypothetical protein